MRQKERERVHERMRSECSDPNAALPVVHKMDGLGFRRTLKVDTHTNTQLDIDQRGSSLFSRHRERETFP